jgi:protease-4
MRKLSLILSASLLGSSLSACRSEPEPQQTPARDDQAKPDDDDDNPLAGLAGNPFAAMIGKKLDEPGPYDPPTQSAAYDDKAPHLRVLKLAGTVAEVEGFDPFSLLAGGGGGTIVTRRVSTTLAELAAEPNLHGLVVRVDALSMDMARASELRAALLEFRGTESARKLYCHAENLDNASYYLLSACDELSMAPVGTLMIPGPVATPIHLKGLLDKLGITADFLHVGAFKGAAEPLTREAPSAEMLETLAAIVAQAHASMVAGISAGRAKSADDVGAWIDRGLYTSEDAAAAGLIDKVEVWEPFLSRVVGERGWKKVDLAAKPWADPAALQRFLGLAPPKRPSEPHVALVYAVGNIIDGKGAGAVGAGSEIASGQLVPVLDRLAADDKVAAVVLRIDSGGGSALASEQIWHAVERLKANKPVVVSMAGVAASGGYYIAAGANEIFADTDTLTGSIGVVGGKLVVGGALEQVGIKSYTVGKGQHASMWSPMQVWTDSERAAVYAMMEQTYQVFVDRVAAGRRMDREAVHAIAQGRVWTGDAAKQRGLVDTLGNLEQALARAAELGKVGEDVGLEVYPGEPTIKDLLGSFEQMVVAPSSTESQLPAAIALVIDSLAATLGPQQQRFVADLRASVATLMALRGTTMWTVEWLRPPT